MARIHVERVLDSLDSDIRRAMQSAVDNEAPDAEIDASGLARAFRRSLVRRLNTWQKVPTNAVEAD
jgi:hypothetical protein